jgi:hypothetical protein
MLLDEMRHVHVVASIWSAYVNREREYITAGGN